MMIHSNSTTGTLIEVNMPTVTPEMIALAESMPNKKLVIETVPVGGAAIVLTQEMIDGISYAMELGAHDQECYLDDGDPEQDYSADEMRGLKAQSYRDAGAAALALNLPGLAARYYSLAETAVKIADEMEVAK